MTRRPAQILIGVAVLSIAVVGGWVVTNLLQDRVSILPGIEGCARLEGMAAQTSCLSEEFLNGADEAAVDTKRKQRDTRVIAYVRDAEELAATDERIAGLCHPAMHKLGRREGKRAAEENRTPLFPDGSSQLCTAGYVHGLAEGYLATSPTADVAAVYPKLCHDRSAREGCAHGIGHALLRAEDAATWTESTPRAIERCAALPDEVAGNCDNGVYMELAMRTEPVPVAPAEYTRICRDGATVDQELACWGYLRTNLTSNDVPLDKVPSWCGMADLPSQYPCIEGYGRDLGAARVGKCSTAAREITLQERCIDGAMGLQVGSGHVSVDDARRHCASLSGRSLRRFCEDAVARYAKGRDSVEAA